MAFFFFILYSEQVRSGERAEGDEEAPAPRRVLQLVNLLFHIHTSVIPKNKNICSHISRTNTHINSEVHKQKIEAQQYTQCDTL